MDKATKFLIRIAYLIIILTITAPSIDKFLLAYLGIVINAGIFLYGMENMNDERISRQK